jgi:hypothetical protein
LGVLLLVRTDRNGDSEVNLSQIQEAVWIVVDSIQTQSRHQSVSLCREYFDGGVTMSRRRKPFHHPTPEYNAYLAGWVFAFSVVLVTVMLIAHGVHF